MAYQIIMVAPNMETSVSRILAALSFEHWIFRIRKQVVYRGRVTERIAPVWPGYVFVFAHQAWTTIRDITGVRGFVRFGGHPSNVPTSLVEGLLSHCDEHGVIDWGQELAMFYADELVKVTLLPDVVVQGRFQHLSPPDRAVVDLDGMGRVNVRVSSIAALEKRRRPRMR